VFTVPGSRSLSVTDTLTGTITTGSVGLTVTRATKLVVTAPSTATASSAFTVTVTAQNSIGETATDYKGTVHFTLSDTGTGAATPTDYSFTVGTGLDNGVHVFTTSTTFVTAGVQIVTATDTGNSAITGNA